MLPLILREMHQLWRWKGESPHALEFKMPLHFPWHNGKHLRVVDLQLEMQKQSSITNHLFLTPLACSSSSGIQCPLIMSLTPRAPPDGLATVCYLTEQPNYRQMGSTVSNLPFSYAFSTRASALRFIMPDLRSVP